jgi:transcriptional regulator GlxA family with amidase domain
MKRVSILVPESSVMQTIADPQQLFTDVNYYAFTSRGKAPLFSIELVGLRKQVKINNGFFTIRTDKVIDEVGKTDLIIIPALAGDMATAIKKNEALIPWIVKQHKKGAEIASLCAGAFLLASTGLLNGRSCTTHWGAISHFRSMYPAVKLAEGNVVTDENRIYTSGGANSYWNLLLYLLEKYTKRETAILAAKYFAIDIDRNSQSVFSVFKGQKKHSDTAVLRTQDYIEANLHEKISINDLLKIANMGRRTFERRFKLATHNSALEYIQRVKIEAAKTEFETGEKNINEVMYDVGYLDIKTFRDIFKKITGITPAEYRSKYNKLVVEN